MVLEAARKHGPTVRLVLDASIITGLIWGGMMVERATRQLEMLVSHMCRVEVILHRQSYDTCMLDFGPSVKFDPRVVDPH